MTYRVGESAENNDLLAMVWAWVCSQATKLRAFSAELPEIRKLRTKFEKTGTAEVVAGERNGVCVKDEGDFVSVRFGSNELTEIGSALYGERHFATSDEAFEFAEQTQSLVRESLRRKAVGASARVSLVAASSE